MATDKPKRKRDAKHTTRGRKGSDAKCGLCGATKNLIKTECCGQWICDDEHEYVMFSYARNSCSRNHRRFTICGNHYAEGHSGHWKDCKKCRDALVTEMYVDYGTNEYNFEVLENPPAFEPTKCISCGAVIVLAEGGYSSGRDGYSCGECTAKKFGDILGR